MNPRLYEIALEQQELMDLKEALDEYKEQIYSIPKEKINTFLLERYVQQQNIEIDNRLEELFIEADTILCSWFFEL